MPSEAVVTIVLLIVTVFAMATQRLRTDIIALLVLLFLIISGILEAEEAFSVFGQPVILIVASIFVIGAALLDTGVATLIANHILRIGQGGETYLMFIVMLTTAVLTAFLDGLLVVALLMPAVLRVARQAHLSPSRLLLPLATTATVGNLLTLIGTTSNPLISDILAASSGARLGLFTMTPYALVSVGLVMAWYLTAGRLFLSRELPPEAQELSLAAVEQSYQLDKLLYRLRVRSSSDLIAESLDAYGGLQKKFGLNVIAIRPQGAPLQPASPEQVLEQDDVLIVEGETGQILRTAHAHGLELKGTVSLEAFNQMELETLRLAELMIPFRSSLVGQSLTEISFRRRYGLNVLAVHRHGQSIRSNLPQLGLAAGDTLLVQGTPDNLHGIGRNLDLIRVTDLGPQPGDLITIKAQWTMIVLGAMLLLVVTGLASLATASVMAAVALVMLKCLSPERAYRSINGSLLILIGGMLSLSIALQKTGAAELIADLIAGLSQGLGVVGSLGLVYLLTSLSAQIIGGAVGAAIFAPIAISLALTQGAPPEPFAIAIAFAVMGGFVSPLTDGDNLLVREPGRYSMADYLKNTLPIFIIQSVALLGMLTLVYDLL
jgi:di/tricarboxylate transporter